MARTCPDCGAAMTYEAHPASILLGTCPGCGHAFTLVDGMLPPPPVSGSGPAGEPPRSPDVGSQGGDGRGVPCETCGSSLTFRAGARGGIQGVCPACHTTQSYRPITERPPARGWSDRRRPFDRGDEEPQLPRTRPCRECGGPLTFSTNPDGTVEGVCAACGNRFTLPPRRGPDRRPRETGGRGFGRRGGGSFGGRPSYRRAGARDRGRTGPPYPRGARRPFPGREEWTRRKQRRASVDDGEDADAT